MLMQNMLKKPAKISSFSIFCCILCAFLNKKKESSKELSLHQFLSMIHTIKIKILKINAKVEIIIAIVLTLS